MSLIEADLLLVDQDPRVLEHALHLVFGVGDEVRRQVALVELHAFDDSTFGREALAFLDGDDAVLADLVHRVGQRMSPISGVVVGGDGSRPGRCRCLPLTSASRSDSTVTTVASTAFSMPRLMRDRVRAGGDVLQAFLEDGLGEHGRGRGAVTGDVGRLATRLP